MSDDLPEPSKRTVLDAYLMHGETHVLIDARQPGVSVPEKYCDVDGLFLKFSHRYGVPLEVSDWGLRCELQFDGVWFPVQVPWCALYAAHCRSGEVEAWSKPADPPPMTKRRGILGVVH